MLIRFARCLLIETPVYPKSSRVGFGRADLMLFAQALSSRSRIARFIKLDYISQVTESSKWNQLSFKTATGYYKSGEGVDIVPIQKGFAAYHYQGREKNNYQKIGFFRDKSDAVKLAKDVLEIHSRPQNVSRENLLAAAIARRGLTGREFAKKVGVSEMTISRLIHGKNTDISVSTFYKLKQESRLPYKKLLDFLIRSLDPSFGSENTRT